MRVARADPRDHVRGPTELVRASRRPFALGAARLGLEQRVEAERLEVHGAIHDAQGFEQPADPRLRRDGQYVPRPLLPENAERRNRQKHVPQRPRMDDERQGRSSASAASWRRPFVASAELE
jgi:hypothetical protein